jgi:hypothetical protein
MTSIKRLDNKQLFLDFESGGFIFIQPLDTKYSFLDFGSGGFIFIKPLETTSHFSLFLGFWRPDLFQDHSNISGSVSRGAIFLDLGPVNLGSVQYLWVWMARRHFS